MTIERIVEFRRTILELDREIQSYIESSPDMVEACQALLELNLAKREVGMVYDGLSNAVSNIMGEEKDVPLDGGAIIEKKSAYDRKAWQHKDLANAVVDKLVKMSIDMDTGEVVKSPTDIALQVLDYCAPSYWRVKELSNIGINADMYCETGQLKTSIIVRKGDK
jgi:hypothetical protein